MKKLYVTIDASGTQSWLTRQTARQNKTSDGLVLEVQLTKYQQAKLADILEATV